MAGLKELLENKYPSLEFKFIDCTFTIHRAKDAEVINPKSTKTIIVRGAKIPIFELSTKLDNYMEDFFSEEMYRSMYQGLCKNIDNIIEQNENVRYIEIGYRSLNNNFDSSFIYDSSTKEVRGVYSMIGYEPEEQENERSKGNL